MYNKRIKFNDNPFWTEIAIFGVATALTIAASLWVNRLQNKWYIEQVQSGKITEQSIVREFVTDFYSNIRQRLPRDYIIMEKERLRKLRDCRTFKDLKRALRYIDLDTSEVDYLEREYKKALASRPKRIGVNGKVAYDRKPKGVITHDSMPWCKQKAVTRYIDKTSQENAKKKLKSELQRAEQSVSQLERSDDPEIKNNAKKIKEKLKQIGKFVTLIGAMAVTSAVPYLTIAGIDALTTAISNRIQRRREEAAEAQRFRGCRANNPRPNAPTPITPRPQAAEVNPAVVRNESASSNNLTKAISGILSGIRELDLSEVPKEAEESDITKIDVPKAMSKIKSNPRYGGLDLDSKWW